MLLHDGHDTLSKRSDTALVVDAWSRREGHGLLTGHDRRGLTPLFWQHILPYGRSQART